MEREGVELVIVVGWVVVGRVFRRGDLRMF